MTATIMIGIIVLGWFVRLLRRRSRSIAQPAATGRDRSGAAGATIQTRTPAPRPRSAKRRLVLRAAQGLLIALLLILCSLLEWPRAGVTSAAIAPDVRLAQAYLWDNRDLLLLGSVVIAMSEPLLIRIVRAVLELPSAMWLIGQLLCVGLRLAYWRIRQCSTNWTWRISHFLWRERRRRFFAACRQPAVAPVPASGLGRSEQQNNELLEGTS